MNDDEALMAELMDMMAGGKRKNAKKGAKEETKKGKAKKNDVPDDDELMAELEQMMAEEEDGGEDDDLKLSDDNNENQDDGEIDESAIGDDSEDEKPQPKKPEPSKPQNTPQITPTPSKPAAKPQQPQQPQQPAKPAAKPPPSYDFMNNFPDIEDPQQNQPKPAQPAAKPQKPVEQKPPEPQKPQPAPKQPEIQQPVQPAPVPQPKKPAAQQEKPAPKPQPKPAPKPKPKPAPKPEPKPAPKPQAPPKPKSVSDIKSTADYDKLFSTFASSFYTFLTEPTKPEGKKFLNQVDQLLPMVLDGPQKFGPNISVINPKHIAPYYSKFSEFQDKDVISCADPVSAAKVLPQIQNTLQELKNDIKALAHIKEDKQKILPLLEASKKLEKTIEIFPDYPFVISDVLKYGFPIVNSDLEPKKIELTIIKGENFPGQDFVIKSQIPVQDELKTLDKNNPVFVIFMAKGFKGKNPLINYTNKWPLTQDSLKFVQKMPATMFFMHGNDEIGHINMEFRGILNNCTVEMECPVLDENEQPTNMKVYTRLRVRKALRGTECKIVNRPILISPIAKFCSNPPPKKPASAKSSNASKPDESEAAKSQLRQPTPAKPSSQQQPSQQTSQQQQKKPDLPYFCVLDDDEMAEFWSIEALMFFAESLDELLKIYKMKKVEPSEQMLKMHKWAKETSQKIMDDVQNERISMEEYKQKLNDAIERERVNVECCTIPVEKRSRNGYLGIMCKELSEFE